MKGSTLRIILFVLTGIAIGYNIKAYQTQIGDQEYIAQKEDQEQSRSQTKAIASPTIITDSENRTIELFEAAAPSVVFITTTELRQNYYSMKVTEIPSGTGSGFLWGVQGHVVTNFHVIESANRSRNAKVKVTLSDQSTYDAEIVGVAPDKDLAVLKIDLPKEKRIPLPVGNSAGLKVGQSVYAIGNPFGLDQTLTTGIISALGREIDSRSGIPIKDVIQTDAAINPGNSGGPLLDSSGKLIGVNTAIYSPSGAYAGIGFSIPVDVVNWIVPDLIKYGEVRKPILGVELLADQYHEESGAMIRAIAPGSAADKAGLRGIQRSRSGDYAYGDIIKKIDDNIVESNSALVLVLEKYEPGDEIIIEFEREGEKQNVNLILGSSVN